RRPAGERLEAQRPRAGIEIEDERLVDRPEDVEDALARPVGGRTRAATRRRLDLVTLPGTGDDPHAVATYSLVHGSWHGGWCWQRLRDELEARGHVVHTPDLPCEDVAA